MRWEGETREGVWGGLKGGKGRVCDGERISRESKEERNVPEYGGREGSQQPHMCVLIPLLPEF